MVKLKINNFRIHNVKPIQVSLKRQGVKNNDDLIRFQKDINPKFAAIALGF
jgi:hypothetical protein